jgi:hypothetical protein
MPQKHLNTKKNKITDLSVIKKIDRLVSEYREIVEDIAITSSLTPTKISDYIKKRLEKKNNSDVDFIAFSKKLIGRLRTINPGSKNAASFQTVVNSLQDFFKSDRVVITDITAKSLKLFEDYLKTERKVFRNDKNGTPKPITLKPVGNGVHNYLKDVRTLFNKAVAEFNDEDAEELIIKHNPFKKYKVPKPAATKKRNVSPGTIKFIRDFKSKSKRSLRSELGRDVFMLTFYLVGINLVDIYEMGHIKKGRLTYNRSKTSTRRDDKALISIKVEPEALVLIEKYRDESGDRLLNFHKHYSSLNNFTTAVNTGLQQLRTELELEGDITSGWARHSWATIATNICKISKDDVDLALNHVDPQHKLADIYIEKDFSMIDESNRKVLDTLR